MQQGPTLLQIELEYHDSKTRTDALAVQLFRDLKQNYIRVSQELQLKNLELQKMREKYEPKKDEKPKK